MTTRRSIYIRKGSSSQMKLQCLATVIIAERFRTHLSDAKLEPHFRIIEAPARHRSYGAQTNASTLRLFDTAGLLPSPARTS